MYAVQPPRYHPSESNWQNYCHYINAQLPSSTKSWLLDSGSLTQRLIKASNNQFRVELISQSWQTPRLSEQILLGIPFREKAIVREVALLCMDQPWVFARSVIPASSMEGSIRRLRKLKNRPLGEMLFKDPTMKRDAFQLAAIDGNSDQIPESLRQPIPLWGRRSKFKLGNNPLMVSEIFLPNFRP